jgi:hypothetical protein
LHVSASERVDDAGELDQEPVAGGLTMRPWCSGAQRLESGERSFFVDLDQAGIAGNIGREDRCKPAGGALWIHPRHSTSGSIEIVPEITSKRSARCMPTHVFTGMIIR